MLRTFSAYLLLSVVSLAGLLFAPHALAQSEPVTNGGYVNMSPSRQAMDPTPPPVATDDYVRPERREEGTIYALYQMAFPLGDYQDYIGKTSFRGLSLMGDWAVFKGLRLGGSLSRQRFQDIKDRTTYSTEGGAITGKLYNYSEAWTMGALAHYRFLRPGAPVRPYVGVELGVAFVNSTTFIADLSFNDYPTGFSFVADAGAMVHLHRDMFGIVALRYHLMKVDTFRVSNPSFLALQLGIAFDL